MNETDIDVLELAREYDNILPYSVALSLSYVGFFSFSDPYKPLFHRYFKPLAKWKNKTFYALCNLDENLGVYMSKSVRRELNLLNPDQPVVISHVLVAGLSEMELDRLISDVHNEDFRWLIDKYDICDSSQESNKLINIEVLQKYEIDVAEPKNNCVMFELKIL